jgi:HK97 family phage major capsid protein
MGRAAELREQALAKLYEAKELEGPDGTVSPEDIERQAALFEEFKGLDDQAATARKAEGISETISDRLSWYNQQATGQPMRFNQTTVETQGKASWGEQFIQSEAYKAVIESGALQSNDRRFNSGQVVVGAVANTDVVQTESSGPANALVLPDYLPGIIGLPGAPLVARDLFSQATTTSDVISYARQTSRSGAAAMVEQATAVNNGAKPQVSIAWERETSPVETVAAWMATTRQALADVGQIRGLIDNQLRFFLALEVDDQLINGNGTSPNLSGILDQTDILTLDADAENLTWLDSIRRARTMIRTGTSRLPADGIVMHPNDSEGIDLLKDGNDNYRGGNPIGNFGFNQPIWGLRRVESEAVAEGTAIVGAFRPGATVYARQGVAILTADQHSDFFVRNLIVVLAEERLGFAVFFPTAFLELTLGVGGS